MLRFIKDWIAKSSEKNKNLTIGFIIGLITPIALEIARRLLVKLQKAKKQTARLYVGIELGGTNYNVAIGSPQYDRTGNLIGFTIKKHAEGHTSANPQQTMTQIANFLTKNQPQNLFGYDFVGIASFGPLCLNQSQDNYGSITSTPKINWRNIELLRFFKNSIRAQKVLIQTDVNAAAFAQYKLGGHKTKESLVYITVGTGVGVGVITQGKTLHGLTHPQGGHIIVQRHKKQYQNFKGVCHYHKDCLEGMVCNISIGSRLNIPHTQLHTIEDNDIIWQIIGHYLGQLCLNLTLILSPQVIIIGGGIMNRKILYNHIRSSFIYLLHQYVENDLFTQENIHKYIKEPSLGHDVGVKGGMILNYMD